MITVGSLFSGIGGIDLGLERAGMECVWQVEIDDYAIKILEKHWPNVRRCRDVTIFPPRPIQEWGCDLIAGGFPCQDISYGGKGAGLNGKRSGLWWEFARIIRQIRPKYVLVENVGALLTRGIDAVLGALASIGYDAEWHCIPAAAVGAPHIRDRVFIFAYSQSINNRSISIKQCIQMSGKEFWGEQPGRRTYQEVIEHGDITGWVVHESRLSRMVNGTSFQMDRLKCIGNAVVPQIAEWIGKQIVEFDRNNK